MPPTRRQRKHTVAECAICFQAKLGCKHRCSVCVSAPDKLICNQCAKQSPSRCPFCRSELPPSPSVITYSLVFAQKYKALCASSEPIDVATFVRELSVLAKSAKSIAKDDPFDVEFNVSMTLRTVYYLIDDLSFNVMNAWKQVKTIGLILQPTRVIYNQLKDLEWWSSFFNEALIEAIAPAEAIVTALETRKDLSGNDREFLLEILALNDQLDVRFAFSNVRQTFGLYHFEDWFKDVCWENVSISALEFYVCYYRCFFPLVSASLNFVTYIKHYLLRGSVQPFSKLLDYLEKMANAMPRCIRDEGIFHDVLEVYIVRYAMGKLRVREATHAEQLAKIAKIAGEPHFRKPYNLEILLSERNPHKPLDLDILARMWKAINSDVTVDHIRQIWTNVKLPLSSLTKQSSTADGRLTDSHRGPMTDLKNFARGS